MTDDDLKAFIRAEVRKALAEVDGARDLRIQEEPPPPRAVFPPRGQFLPAWARYEEGTGH